MSRSNKFTKFIATTTINAPTLAYERFRDDFKDWCLVIAGDQATPGNEYKKFVKKAAFKNVIYLSLYQQDKLFKGYSDMVGFNTASRRVFAMLYAYQLGAEIIALIDDDNIPLENWGKDLVVGKTQALPCWTHPGVGIVDPIYIGLNPKAKVRDQVWHRGFPIDHLESRNQSLRIATKLRPINVQADMWLGEPDIDAVNRMVLRRPKLGLPWDLNKFPFTVKGFSPFNSQNTFITREIVPHYVAFPGLQRLEDIWLSYYVEMLGYRVAYGAPSVFQNRNKHNPLVDFKAELIGYQRAGHLFSVLKTEGNTGDLQRAKAAFLQLIPRYNGYTASQLSVAHRKVINKINNLRYEKFT